MDQEAALTHADVERIIELAEEGGFSYVRLESDGVELVLMREGHAPADPGSRAVASAAGPARTDAPPPVAPAPSTDAPAPVAPAPSAAGVDGGSPAGLVGTVVVSPMIGIVYLSASPTAQPYVQVGQAVSAGDTVALVEVMKMFTPVEAGASGVVEAVLVENGQHVDRGQPLLRLAD